MHCPEDYSSEAETPFCCCYLSPPHLDAHSYLAALEDVITPYLASNLCLLGDFNAKHSAWFCGQITDGPGIALKQFADTSDLKQILGELTYNVTTDHPSLLDLVFTNRPQCVRSTCVLSPIAGHCPVVVSLSFKKTRSQKPYNVEHFLITKNAPYTWGNFHACAITRFKNRNS